MTTSEVLHRAADRVQRCGLHKGGAFPSDRVFEEDFPACAAGHIGAVAVEMAHEQGQPVDYLATSAATQALREHVGRFIIDWSDDPQTTATDVVAAMRAAAAVEELKEQTARGMPTPDDEPVRFPIPDQRRPSDDEAGVV